MTDTDSLAAELDPIRQRRAKAVDRGGDAAEWLGAAYRLADEDVPRLLAAVDAVLKLHHRLHPEAHCEECRKAPYCGHCGSPWPCRDYEDLRSAVLAELTGKGDEEATRKARQQRVPDDSPDRCEARYVRPDGSEDRCVLHRDHVLDDTDHVNARGQHAPVLFHQSTIEQARALRSVPWPWECGNGK